MRGGEININWQSSIIDHPHKLFNFKDGIQ